jgi:DNA-binding transcriptional LysR family regulator
MDDFRQLRHLVALVEYGTVTLAADSLGITRSALSQSVRRIEDMYSVPLFERVKRRIRPTIYCKLLVNAARRSIDIFQDTQREIQLVRNMESGQVTIGCDPSLAELLLPQTLAGVIRLHPGLHFAVETGFWWNQIDALRDDAIDIYLGIRPDGELGEFAVQEFMLPGLLVYCRQGHPLTRQPRLTMNDVVKYPRVGPPVPRWFTEAIGEAVDYPLLVDGRAERAVLANDGGIMREIVRYSDAVAAGFRHLIEADVRGAPLSILPIASNPFARPIPGVIVSRHDRVLSPLAQHLVSTLTGFAATLVRAEQNGVPLADA